MKRFILPALLLSTVLGSAAFAATCTTSICKTDGTMTFGSGSTLTADSGSTVTLSGTTTLSGTNTFGATTFSGDVTVATAKAIHPDTTTAHTMLLQAYDVDGTAYKTFGTFTNGNTPTYALSQPSGGTLTWDGGAIGGTTPAAGAFTTLSAGTSLQVNTTNGTSITAIRFATDTVANGQTSKTVTLTGVTSSSKCVATGNEVPTNAVYIKSAAPGTDQVVITTSGDPGASNLDLTVICMN